jgi:hypothetical protein
MIYNFEDIDKEQEEILDWRDGTHLRNVDEMISKLSSPPQSCDYECQSQFISATNCQCMRDVFDNEQHKIDYQHFLYMAVGLMLLDTIHLGYQQNKTYEQILSKD